MTETHAPNLTADWLNGWLAAIGITVAVPNTRLHWTDDVAPHAVVTHPARLDLPAAVATQLVDLDLDATPIARTHPAADLEFARNVTIDAYRERARLERASTSGLLAASVTDLKHDFDPSNLDHGPFDPPAPRGETLASRAERCQKAIAGDGDPKGLVTRNLMGVPVRIKANGLGFDHRRLVTGVQTARRVSDVHADPVVEMLCLFALALFPSRGEGRTVRGRGWTGRPTRRRSFCWPTWSEPLDRWAIDALLDRPDLYPARYGSVPYKPANPSDPTRAYGTDAL